MSTLAEHIQKLVELRGRIKPGENVFLMWDNKEFSTNALLLCTTHLDELADRAAATEPMREAIKEALTLLRPEAPECSGCAYEWNHAVKVLRAALAADQKGADHG